LAYLVGPGHVYVQNNRSRVVRARADLREQCAIPVTAAKYLEAFEKFTCSAAALEFFGGKEMVVDAVGFARAR
jgi:hypothetical protein